MNKAIPLCFLVLTTTLSAAQSGDAGISPATKNYRAYRLQNTVPTYGLKKVKGLIESIKPNPKDQDDLSLSKAAFNRMSTAEKFTYCMLHGEVASQNCDGMPWVVGEEKKVFAQLPGLFADDEAWSSRQTDFLVTHRKEVLRFITETIRKERRVGVNLKQAICRIEGNELIPELVKVYNRDHRDQDILTVFALLMKEGEFKPFMSSATYHKFYGPDANYQSFIEANPANQKLMIDRAMAFYRAK